MAFRQIKSPALADKAVLNTKLDESAVQGQSALTGMIDPANCFTLLYDVNSDSLKKITAEAFFGSFTTDSLLEGDNKYFTPERAQAAVASDIASSVLVETNRATAAETLLQSNVDAEASTRAQADVTLQSNITAEETRSKAREDSIEAASQSADTALSTRIDNILSNTDSAAIDSFVEVIGAFQDADDVLSGSIIANSAAITSEVARATGKETVNATAISVESARATAAEVAITSLLSAEEIARIAADAALSARVTTEEQTSTSLQSQVTAEVSRASGAESVLTQGLAAEVTRATGSEAANAQNLQDEIVARGVADTQVRTDIAADIVTSETASKAYADAKDVSMIGDATVDGTTGNTITDRVATAKAGAESVASLDAAAKVLVEKTRAEAAESSLQSQITSNDGDVVTLQTADSTETAARIAGDSGLQSQIDFITSNTDAEALESLTEIVGAFQDADSDLSALVGSNTTAISTEKARAEAAESVLQTNIGTEASTRASADTGLQGQINVEEAARIAGDSATLVSAKSYTDQEADSHQAAAQAHADSKDTALIGDASVNGTSGNTITSRIATAKAQAFSYTDTKVSTEAATRLAADDALSLRTTLLEGEMDSVESLAAQNEIDVRAEEVARAAGDAGLQGQLTAEVARATSAEGVLSSSITSEVTRAQGVEATNAASVVTERQRAELVEAGLRTDVNTNTVNISSNLGAVTSEVTRAKAAEVALGVRVDDASALQVSDHADNQSQITAEVTRASGVEAGLQTSVDSLQGQVTSNDVDIAALATLQSSDHSDNQSQITAEVTRAKAAEVVNANAIAAEATRASGVEAGLQTSVDANHTASQLQITANDADILALQTLQASDHADNQSQITAEVTRASGVEAGLRTDVTTLEGRVDFIVSNDDGAALDSLTEIVSAFQDADSDLTGVITANSGRLTSVEGRATVLETDVNTNKIGLQIINGRFNPVEAYVPYNEARALTQVDQILAIQTLQGSTALETTATDFSTAINELHTEIGLDVAGLVTLAARVTTEEGHVDTLQSEMDAVEGRATSLETRVSTEEGHVDALQTKMGTTVLATVATDVTGAINELHTELDGEAVKVVALEAKAVEFDNHVVSYNGFTSWAAPQINDINNRVNSNDGEILALETKLGDGVFDTTSQFTTGAINELHGEINTGVTALAAVVARADVDSDALASEIVSRTAADLLIRSDLAAFRTTDEADYIARDAVVLASAKSYAESEADDAEAAAKIYADGIVSGEATLRDNADVVLDGKIATEATARAQGDNALDTRLQVVEGEMSATQLAAGVNADGTYASPDGTNYIDLSTSLADADKKLDTALKTADNARIAGDVNLQAQMDAEISRATSAEGLVTANLTTEVARATAAEAANGVLIVNNATAISAEASRAQGVESSLQSQVDFITSNTDGDALDSLTELVAAFQGADGTLTGLVNQNQTDISTNAASLVQEVSDRIAGDTAVRGEFATADAGLQTQIDGLVSKSGDAMTGVLAMGGNKVSGLANGTVAADAINKGQLDSGLAAQHISQFSSSDLAEGDKKFFTPTRVHDAVSVVDVSGEGKVSETAGVFSLDTSKAFVELTDVVDTDLVDKQGFVARVKTDGTGIELVDPASLQFNDAKRQVISGDGSQSTFALDFYTQEANAMVFVGGVIQDPSVHYTIDATSQMITFMAAIPVGTQVVVIAQSTNSVGVLDPKSVGIETLADNIKVFEQGNDVIVGTSATVVSTFNKAVTRSAKYVVTVESNGEFETRECLVIHDGTNPYITEYGVLFTGANMLGDTDVQINGSSVELTYTAVIAGAVVSVSASKIDV